MSQIIGDFDSIQRYLIESEYHIYHTDVDINDNFRVWYYNGVSFVQRYNYGLKFTEESAIPV